MTPEGVTIRHPDKLFIGGEWVAPLSGESIEVVNPNSEEVIARVAACRRCRHGPRGRRRARRRSTTARGRPPRRPSAARC